VNQKRLALYSMTHWSRLVVNLFQEDGDCFWCELTWIIFWDVVMFGGRVYHQQVRKWYH
jgi:hypothetical protein